nr:radical SAM protein [Nanoarchaeota archaeon]
MKKFDKTIRKKSSQTFSSLNQNLSFSLNMPINKSSRLFKETELVINKNRPSLVGISVVHYYQLNNAIQVARIIKSINKKTFIVFGGPIITNNIERIIEHKEIEKFTDGFVVNDGEEPLAKLIYSVENCKKLSKVPNLYYKTKSGFKRSRHSFLSTHEHLKVMPNFEGLQFSFLSLRTSLGCYWGKCAFCTYRIMHKKYVQLNPEEVIKIIKVLIEKYDVSMFEFVDEALSPTFLKKISKEILKENLKISWSCLACFDKGFFNESIPKIMKKSGCINVTMGLESMNPRILKLMNKMHIPDHIKKILRSFRKADLDVRLTCIAGFPTETKQEAYKTFQFLKNNKHLYKTYRVQPFCLEENTFIYKNPEKFGIKEIDKSEKYSGMRFGFKYKVKKGMNQKEAEKLIELERKGHIMYKK